MKEQNRVIASEVTEGLLKTFGLLTLIALAAAFGFLVIRFYVHTVWDTTPAAAAITPARGRAHAVSPPPEPVYGWQEIKRVDFALDPLHFAQSLPLPEGTFKFDLDATHSVTSGVVWKNTRIALFADPTPRGVQQVKQNLFCADANVYHLEASECETHSSDMDFIVFDDRNASRTVVNGVVAFFTHSAAAGERAIAPNRVSVKISVWTCLRNCRSS